MTLDLRSRNSSDDILSMSTDTLLHRFSQRDPVLLAALFSGDTVAVRAITRLLRHTPLTMLLQHQAALVIALVAIPETHRQLSLTWMQQDPDATHQIFSWVEQSRRRLRRSGTPVTWGQ